MTKNLQKKNEHKMALFVENFDTLKKVWIKLLLWRDGFFSKSKVTQGIVL